MYKSGILNKNLSYVNRARIQQIRNCNFYLQECNFSEVANKRFNIEKLIFFNFSTWQFNRLFG